MVGWFGEKKQKREKMKRRNGKLGEELSESSFDFLPALRGQGGEVVLVKGVAKRIEVVAGKSHPFATRVNANRRR